MKKSIILTLFSTLLSTAVLADHHQEIPQYWDCKIVGVDDNSIFKAQEGKDFLVEINVEKKAAKVLFLEIPSHRGAITYTESTGQCGISQCTTARMHFVDNEDFTFVWIKEQKPAQLHVAVFGNPDSDVIIEMRAKCRAFGN